MASSDTAAARCPSRRPRSGICETGPGVATGNTNDKQQRRGGARHHRADDPAEQHNEGCDEHADDRQRRHGRDERPEADHHDAGKPQQRLRAQAVDTAAGEVRHQQHRERAAPNTRKYDISGFSNHLRPEREHRRHQDRRARGAPGGAVVQIVGSQPVAQPPWIELWRGLSGQVHNLTRQSSPPWGAPHSEFLVTSPERMTYENGGFHA